MGLDLVKLHGQGRQAFVQLNCSVQWPYICAETLSLCIGRPTALLLPRLLLSSYLKTHTHLVSMPPADSCILFYLLFYFLEKRRKKVSVFPVGSKCANGHWQQLRFQKIFDKTTSLSSKVSLHLVVRLKMEQWCSCFTNSFQLPHKSAVSHCLISSHR